MSLLLFIYVPCCLSYLPISWSLLGITARVVLVWLTCIRIMLMIMMTPVTIIIVFDVVSTCLFRVCSLPAYTHTCALSMLRIQISWTVRCNYCRMGSYVKRICTWVGIFKRDQICELYILHNSMENCYQAKQSMENSLSSYDIHGT